MTVGAKVRIIQIAASVLARLPVEEQQDVQSMLGEAFEVYDVDEDGAAWVEKCWKDHEGERSHSLALDPHEMELV